MEKNSKWFKENYKTSRFIFASNVEQLTKNK